MMISQILKQNYPHMQDKFLCLPNLTSSNLVEKMSEEYEVTEFDKNKFNILSIGRLTKQKGYDIAINALKILKEECSDVHWWIIGAGELEDQLKKQVKDNELEEYITYHGIVGGESKRNLLKECYIFALPTRYPNETFSTDASSHANDRLILFTLLFSILLIYPTQASTASAICSCVILFFTLCSFSLLPIVNFTCSPPFEI